MNTRLYIGSKNQKLIIALLSTSLLIQAYSLEAQNRSAESYQQQLLFNPTDPQLKREHDGMVFMYDGMKDKTIERAMDEEFHRVSAMMFVRTVVTDEQGDPLIDKESGELVQEEDGCD